jgi:crotonobetainyl-CoA:carnitine CoA-transferase CaiB-like acyl-CoA transferase
MSRPTRASGSTGSRRWRIGINRNKRSLALDIGKPEGKAVLLRLLEAPTC